MSYCQWLIGWLVGWLAARLVFQMVSRFILLVSQWAESFLHGPKSVMVFTQRPTQTAGAILVGTLLSLGTWLVYVPTAGKVHL